MNFVTPFFEPIAQRMERASRPPCDGFPSNPALSRATMMTWLLTAFGTVLPLLLCTHVHFVHGDDPTSSLRSRGQQHGPDGIIVHLHIPKTAGAFLRQYMSQSLEARRHRNVPESEFFGYGLGGQGSFLAKSAEVQAQYGAVHGHIGYGMHQQPGWTRGLPRYTTVLRNPVDRIISQFQYEVRSPMGLAFGAKLPAKDSTTLTEGQLFEWFDDMQQHRTNHSVWSAHNNPMTQQLCCFKDDVGRPPFGPPCLNQPVNAETLACAVRNLGRFAVVGLTEAMDDTLKLFEYAVGLVPHGNVNYRNSAPSSQKVHVSAEGRHRLANACKYDRQLYEHGVKLFARQQHKYLGRDL